jgi:hypothetical protein
MASFRKLSYAATAGLIAFALGCTDAASPDPVNKYAELSTERTVFMGSPGEQLQSLPVVTVYDYRTREGIPNVSVHFTSSGGPAVDYTTKTGPDGAAQLNSLKLSDTPLKYSIVATVDGVGSVSFTTIAVSSTVTQTYVLVSEGGTDVTEYPLRSVLELFDDDTYARGVDRNGTTTFDPSRGRYVAGGASVTFCVDLQRATSLTFLSGCGSIRQRGTVFGDSLYVTTSYDSYSDSDVELPDLLYARVK